MFWMGLQEGEVFLQSKKKKSPFESLHVHNLSSIQQHESQRHSWFAKPEVRLSKNKKLASPLWPKIAPVAAPAIGLGRRPFTLDAHLSSLNVCGVFVCSL